MAEQRTISEHFEALDRLIYMCEDGTFYYDYDESSEALAAATEALGAIKRRHDFLVDGYIDITSVDPVDAILDPTRPIRIAEAILGGRE